MSAEIIHIRYPDGKTWKNLDIERTRVRKWPIEIVYPGKFDNKTMCVDRPEYRPRSPYQPGYKLLDAGYCGVSGGGGELQLFQSQKKIGVYANDSAEPTNQRDPVTMKLSGAIARSGVAVEGIIDREIEDNDWGFYEEKCKKKENRTLKLSVYGGIIAVSVFGAALHHGAVRTYASEELRQIQAESGFVPTERSTFCDKIERDNIANSIMRPILKPVAEYFDQCKTKEVQVAKVVFESK